MNALLKILALLATLASINPANAGIAQKVTRAQVSGVDLIAYPTAIKDVVTLVGSMPAGDAFAPQSNLAIATLTGMMLDRGTAFHDKYAIAQQLENAGATISFGVDNQTLNIHGRCLRRDLPLVVHLLAEQLRSPAFDAAEFEKVRQQFIGAVRNSLDSTEFRASDAFSRAVFPPSHPNRSASSEALLAAAAGASVEEANAFHRKFYGPRHLTLVMVGDVDIAAVKREVTQSFRGWDGGVDALQPSASARPDAARRDIIDLKDKPSVSIILGQATGLRYRDADALALRVGTAILGSGFTGRLMSSIRDKEGLTYGIGASIAEDSYADGQFAISASFAPQLLDRGLAATRAELLKWQTGGVSAQELIARKASLIGSFEVSLSSTGGLAAAILITVQRGLPLSWLDDYPKAIRALTLDQVNAAIRQNIDPAKMVLIEAGSVSAPAP